MPLTAIDWTIIAAYILFNLAYGLFYRKRATGSVNDYFISGRRVPGGWPATSMVATTFDRGHAAGGDRAGRPHGIAGNWIWWCMVFSGMQTVFFYAKLWRRAGVMTDVESPRSVTPADPRAFICAIPRPLPRPARPTS
jgi:Na+/proline symporter